MVMSLTAIRLISSCLLFLLTLLVGTVPVYLYQKWVRRKSHLRRERKNNPGSDHEHILSSNFYVQGITQVGGGILFFTVLVHMIPENRNNFEKYLKSNHSIFGDQTKEHRPKSIEDLSLPYLEIAICVGFFAIYFAEVLMHSILDRKHESNDRINILKDKTVTEGLNNNEKSDSQSTVNNSSRGGHEEEYDETSAIIGTESSRQNRCHSHREDEPVVIVIDHICHEEEIVAVKDRLLIRFLHGLVLISSFSIHSIFDGISIGVRAESSDIWTMFIAIASHKLMIALIISVELYEKCQSFLLMVFHMTLFSIMSPIGIITVLLAEQSLDTNSEANPIVILLSAIASGTILYIVFFEILQKSRVSKLSPIIQFIAMFVGFGLMFMISITLSEE